MHLRARRAGRDSIPVRRLARHLTPLPRRKAIPLVALLPPLAACGDAVGPGTPPEPLRAVAWNEVARGLVADRHTPPPFAARAYALLAVAQHEALAALPPSPTPGWRRVAIGAALEAASLPVLQYLFPEDAALLAAAAREIHGPPASGSAAEAGRAAGEAAAAAALDRGRGDGSDAPWDGALPTIPGSWYPEGDPPPSPVGPRFGEVRPWVLASGADLDPGPPSAWGSPEFLGSLEEVRQVAEGRTAEHERIARFWEDGPGTAGPPGRFNRIACDLIVEARLDEEEAARILALLNMAEADAAIAVWAAKYRYWVMRPSQADPRITLVVGLPNFPAYPSGHSAFGAVGAGVLGVFFPHASEELHRMAEENGVSRIYGGVHYMFDNTAGLELGYRVATLVLNAHGVPTEVVPVAGRDSRPRRPRPAAR